MATEAQLLSDIALKFDKVSTPVEIQAEDSNLITWMQVNVFESGKSEVLQVPVAYRKNIDYYVFKKGLGTEKAFYREEPRNTSSKDPISSSLTPYELTSALLKSDSLKNKTLGYIITKSATIYSEDVGTANHAQRLVLASKILANPINNVDTFLSLVAIDTNVRSAGNLATDANIATVVDAWWTNIALN